MNFVFLGTWRENEEAYWPKEENRKERKETTGFIYNMLALKSKRCSDDPKKLSTHKHYPTCSVYTGIW